MVLRLAEHLEIPLRDRNALLLAAGFAPAFRERSLAEPAAATGDGSQRYATPLQISTRLGTVSFLNTNTIFGTPTDVTLSELALEMLFPADEATVAIVKSMVDEDAGKIAEHGEPKSHTDQSFPARQGF